MGVWGWGGLVSPPVQGEPLLSVIGAARQDSGSLEAVTGTARKGLGALNPLTTLEALASPQNILHL